MPSDDEKENPCSNSLAKQTNTPNNNKKKLHLLNALFIDPTLDLWIGMCAIDETAVAIIGLKKTNAHFSRARVFVCAHAVR